MNLPPNRRAALITGGSSGVGLATAKRFAGNGFDVLICGRDPQKLAAAQSEIEGTGGNCEIVTIDLDRDAVRAGELVKLMLDHFGRIDVLVNNAAHGTCSTMAELSPQDFETTINLNHRAVFYLTQAAWRQMSKQFETDGSPCVIINMSSLAAFDPFPGLAVYGASKAWMDLLTLALADEGRKHGIRVFSIRPGAVETPLLRSLFPVYPRDQAMGPEQVADKVWDVCQDDMASRSGQAFDVT